MHIDNEFEDVYSYDMYLVNRRSDSVWRLSIKSLTIAVSDVMGHHTLLNFSNAHYLNNTGYGVSDFRFVVAAANFFPG